LPQRSRWATLQQNVASDFGGYRFPRVHARHVQQHAAGIFVGSAAVLQRLQILDHVVRLLRREVQAERRVVVLHDGEQRGKPRLAQPSRRRPIPAANESSTVEWQSAGWPAGQPAFYADVT
jgi:hypothetical protein